VVDRDVRSLLFEVRYRVTAGSHDLLHEAIGLLNCAPGVIDKASLGASPLIAETLCLAWFEFLQLEQLDALLAFNKLLLAFTARVSAVSIVRPYSGPKRTFNSFRRRLWWMNQKANANTMPATMTIGTNALMFLSLPFRNTP
jgi:hypothetical protein